MPNPNPSPNKVEYGALDAVVGRSLLFGIFKYSSVDIEDEKIGGVHWDSFVSFHIEVTPKGAGFSRNVARRSAGNSGNSGVNWSKKGRPPKENNAKSRKEKLYDGALMVSMEA